MTSYRFINTNQTNQSLVMEVEKIGLEIIFRSDVCLSLIPSLFVTIKIPCILVKNMCGPDIPYSFFH